MLTALGTSWDGPFVARSRMGDGPVQVWDLDRHFMASQFSTVLDAGGARLAISTDGRQVAAAAYGRGGFALYATEDGRQLWQRRDLNRIQHVGIAPTNTSVWCTSESGRAYFLHTVSGATVEEATEVKDLFVSPLRSTRLVFHGDDYRVLDDPPRGFASAGAPPLDCGFGPSLVCISEIGGLLRCFDTGTWRETHRALAREGCHWVAIGYFENEDIFMLVRYPYADEGPLALERFDPRSGRVECVTDLESPKYVFCRRGSLVLGSYGDLRRSSDGSLTHDFGWWSRSEQDYI